MNLLSTRQKIFIAKVAHRFVKAWRRLRGLPSQAEFTRGGLRTFLELPHGIPNHDTFKRLFAALDPQRILEAFLRWT